MNKLKNLVLSAVAGASLLTTIGCTGVVYIREHVRPRVIHHHHPRNDYPLLVLCYEWPGHNNYCHHQNCYGRYFLEFGYQGHHHSGSAFQYRPEKQAFPSGPKVERRGSIKPPTGQSKEPRRAFPKQDNHKKSFSIDVNSRP